MLFSLYDVYMLKVKVFVCFVFFNFNLVEFLIYLYPLVMKTVYYVISKKLEFCSSHAVLLGFLKFRVGVGWGDSFCPQAGRSLAAPSASQNLQVILQGPRSGPFTTCYPTSTKKELKSLLIKACFCFLTTGPPVLLFLDVLL